jgi:hypothetical protein
MGQLPGFALGFVVGWAARSTVDSSREMVVKVVSLGFTAIEHIRRILALERERLDDLVAESRQYAQARSAGHGGATATTSEPTAREYR